MSVERAGGPVVHLAVALDGAGWHPAAWREHGAHPRELLTARYWADLVARAQAGLLDLVTIEDSFGPRPQEPDRTDRVRGRLDAVLIAARVAPLTSGIGLVPTAVTTHTEPFHVSKAIATLDHITSGRAGVLARPSARADEAAHVGRRSFTHLSPEQAAGEVHEEAAAWVDVVRRLWDSWEDDAEIRDVATGRFIDRRKLHHIDVTSPWFSVKGPSITPRPPQGQPLVAAAAHGPDDRLGHQLIAASADVGFVTPNSGEQASAIAAAVRRAQQAAGRGEDVVHLFGDVTVFLDEHAPAAQARVDRLDELAGTPLTSDALVFAGTPAQLADLAQEWVAAGLSGLRLRPGAIPHDLAAITGPLAGELARRGLFRDDYEAPTLRGLLGLGRPANRYASA